MELGGGGRRVVNLAAGFVEDEPHGGIAAAELGRKRGGRQPVWHALLAPLTASIS